MKQHEGIIGIKTFIKLSKDSDMVILEKGEPLRMVSVDEGDDHFHMEEETEDGTYEFDLNISEENVDFFIREEENGFIVGDGNDQFFIQFIKARYLSIE